MGAAGQRFSDAVASKLLDDDVGVVVAAIQALGRMGTAGAGFAPAVALKVTLTPTLTRTLIGPLIGCR